MEHSSGVQTTCVSRLVDLIGRGERIRTFDFYLPKVALYQAELHPVA
jgi:hypothetical protein